MNVPAHLIFGAAAFGKPGNRWVNVAALLGSFAPDMSLFVMAGWSLFVMQVSPEIVFGQYYFSDAWQQVFAIDYSFFLWGGGMAAAWYWRRPVAIAFTGAGLLHLLTDFLLHHDDARMQFWPISNWVFHSPISYWDSRYYGAIVGPLEGMVSMTLAVLLWRRFNGRVARVLIALTLLLELITGGFFGLLFSH